MVTECNLAYFGLISLIVVFTEIEKGEGGSLFHFENSLVKYDGSFRYEISFRFLIIQNMIFEIVSRLNR